MKSHIQFVTTPTADTPGTCLVLHFDNKRYLIGNVHEGLQRAAVERQLRLFKISDIFFSGKTEWRNLGGTIGVILTLADTFNSAVSQIAEGKERPHQRLTLHGGANILYTLATTRRFIFRQGLPVDVNEYDRVTFNLSNPSKPSWSDENIRVWAMPISPETSAGSIIEPASSPLGKRDFHDYLEKSPRSLLVDDNEQSPTDWDQQPQRLKLLRGVVSDMFNSDWRLDALTEMPLSEVQMPAALFVRDPKTKHIRTYDGPRPGSNEPLPDLTVLVRKPWPGALIKDLPSTKPSPTSMCYIIRNHPQRGRFLAAKAKEYRVKPGPDFGKLASGLSVVSEDGKIVLPEQVLGPGKAGGGFILAEVPSVEYVSNLINRPEWHIDEVVEGVEVVIWILGPGVAQNLPLQEFINRYNRAKHVISSVDHSANYAAFDSSAAATIRHCQLDPSRFGLPIHNNGYPALPASLGGCTIAKRGMIVQLEPSVEIQDAKSVPPLNTAAVVQQTPPEVLSLARSAWEVTHSKPYQQVIEDQQLPSPDAEIITLGTGSALPSKYRNVSSTLLRVPGCGSYILDCGENTLGQLTRMYKPNELREILGDLRVIWISHMHADHHLGLTSVIKAWYKEVHGHKNENISSHDPRTNEDMIDLMRHVKETQRLVIVSEPTMTDWLKEYSEVEDFGYAKLLLVQVVAGPSDVPQSTSLRWQGLPVGFGDHEPKVVSAMQLATGLVDLQSAYVPHTRGSRGVALTFPGGFKITFSGDCRPSRTLVEIGMDSTVLIHEATFEDELQGDAVAKKHSTTSEAIGVGFAMRARRIILTHFSQRYQKIPSMEGMDGQNVELEEHPINEDASELAVKGENEVPIDLNTSLQTQSATAEKMPGDSDATVSYNASALMNAQRSRSGSRARQQPQVETKIAVAFDFMRVKVKDIMSLEKFAPTLVKLYEDQDKGGKPSAKGSRRK